jgi:hypothetical protein
MIHQDESSIIEDVLKVLTLREPEELKSAIKVLLNAAMKIEREEALQAAPYEWSVERTGYGNGFKDQTISRRRPTNEWPIEAILSLCLMASPCGRKHFIG